MLRKVKRFLTCLVPAVLSLTLSAQPVKPVDYVVYYDFICVKDTVNESFHQPKEFILLHAGEESRFHTVNGHYNDSMALEWQAANPHFANPKTQEEMQAAVDAFTKAKSAWQKSNSLGYYLRKDFAEQIFQVALPFGFPPQHLEEPLTFGWQMGSEQNTILGLNCYRATASYGGRRYTAWFSPEIPISDGPYVFCGLPGLIVQISDERGWYTFRLKNMTTEPGERFWKEDYLNPHSRAIGRKSYVDQSVAQKNNPRLAGARLSEEQLLDVKDRYRQRFFQLLESY